MGSFPAVPLQHIWGLLKLHTVVHLVLHISAVLFWGEMSICKTTLVEDAGGLVGQRIFLGVRLRLRPLGGGVGGAGGSGQAVPVRGGRGGRGGGRGSGKRSREAPPVLLLVVRAALGPCPLLLRRGGSAPALLRRPVLGGRPLHLLRQILRRCFLRIYVALAKQNFMFNFSNIRFEFVGKSWEMKLRTKRVVSKIRQMLGPFQNLIAGGTRSQSLYIN